MKDQLAEPHMILLRSYVLASADMYYVEMGRRNVFLSCNEQGDFRILGKWVDGNPSATTDLFEIFLEYALYCCSWADKEETLFYMHDFGERLGTSLAKQIKNNILLSPSRKSASQILKYILETVDAHPSVEKIDTGVQVVITDYPLEKAAKRSGLRNVELAHYGINSMCECLIHCINPHLVVNTSSDECSEFIFTILMPSYA